MTLVEAIRSNEAAALSRLLDEQPGLAPQIDAPLPGFGLRVAFYQRQQVLVFQSCKRLLVHEA